MEDQDPSAEYIKAFNEGYLLAKYMPKLSEGISKATSKSVSLDAFKSGREQYLIEVEKDLSIDKENTAYPKWLSEDRLNENHKASDIDKDIEPEK